MPGKPFYPFPITAEQAAQAAQNLPDLPRLDADTVAALGDVYAGRSTTGKRAVVAAAVDRVLTAGGQVWHADTDGYPAGMSAEERAELAYLASGDLSFAASLLPEEETR